MNKKIFLAAVIFLGLLLRIIFINTNPPSLYGDELTITLDAYSLLKTGHDQLGNFLPLTFPMGAGRPAAYVYAAIPFVALFGPTAQGARALSVFSGLGIILLIYLIGKKLFSEKLGLFASAIAAVSPWDISLSRGGFEAHFALFLTLLGIYAFILAKQKSFLYILSALSFGLTLHTYPTYKVSLILFLPLLFWYQGRILWNKKYFIMGILVFVALGILSLVQTFTNGSETRFQNINILSQGVLKNSIEQKINLERQISNLPFSLSKYFHNKPIEYGKVFIEDYLQNFSLDFLVLHGDRNPRHNMGTTGEIYFAEIFLIFMGIVAFWQNQKRLILFLLLWVLLAPIPSAAIDLPHALRSAFMLPPLLIFSALGLVTIFNYRNKILLSLVTLLFIIQFVFFAQKIYFLAPNEYSNFWSYPAKLASDKAIENKDKYKYIIISDRIDDIEFAYPLYAAVEPYQIIDQNKNKSDLAGYKFKKYENVYIGYVPDRELRNFLDTLNESVFYIGSTSSKDYLTGVELVEGKNKQLVFIVKRITK